MDMQVLATSQDAVMVVLAGRIDTAGSAKIDLPFNAVAGSGRHGLVDPSAVVPSSPPSASARSRWAPRQSSAVAAKLLLNSQPEVGQVLETIGVTDMLPIVPGPRRRRMAAFGV